MKGRTLSYQLKLKEKIQVDGRRFRIEVEDTQTESGDPEAFVFVSSEPPVRAAMANSIRVVPANPIEDYEPPAGLITLFLPGSATKVTLVSLIVEDMED